MESVDQLRDVLWRETLAKAQKTMERLRRTQAPDHVIETLKELIEDLGSSVEAVNPGSILMRSRALDAISATFNTDEYRNEMMADAYAMFDDLVGSVSLLRQAIQKY